MRICGSSELTPRKRLAAGLNVREWRDLELAGEQGIELSQASTGQDRL
jgi:hypothetical protein